MSQQQQTGLTSGVGAPPISGTGVPPASGVAATEGTQTEGRTSGGAVGPTSGAGFQATGTQPTTTTGGNTFFDFVKNDHDKVRTLFDEYKKAPTSEMKQQIAYHIIREISMHSSKEEEVIYPVFKKLNWNEDYDRSLKDHQEIKNALYDFSSMDADKDINEFDNQASKVEGIFSTHAMFEESDEMQRLLKESSIDSIDLGNQFNKAGEHAVTRPHPWAPSKAPANWFSNRLTAPFDAAADAIHFSGAPQPTV